MFIYDTVNFIFTEISAKFYKNACNREGLARGGGLDQIKNVIIQSLQFYAQFANKFNTLSQSLRKHVHAIYSDFSQQ